MEASLPSGAWAVVKVPTVAVTVEPSIFVICAVTVLACASASWVEFSVVELEELVPEQPYSTIEAVSERQRMEKSFLFFISVIPFVI